MFHSDEIGKLVGSIALALIVGALCFQYIGHIQPCLMCHWQRWPLIAAAIVGIGGIRLWKKNTRSLAMLTIVLVAASGLIAAYQTGMQLDIFPDPKACKIERLFVFFGPTLIENCSDVNWSLFGLSLAAYNTIFSLGTAAVGTFFITRSAK